ncbi:aspartic proteinase nepenthesin-2-like [Nicotiana tomentosiformis]|uniref:aspartic proteinase nepenthesin-2-like n=1 Tax=Nicotiana tomentosiformis TaxID=4098 RepID=UPI00051C8CF7
MTIRAKLVWFEQEQNSTSQIALNDMRSALLQRPNHGFVANISIGEPAINQLVLMDTVTRYYPANSSTYSIVPFNYWICRYFNGKRGNRGECVYTSSYVDRSRSIGTLSRETFHFTTSNNTVENVSRIAFGCGTDNVGTGFGSQYSGILGLGPSEASILTQVGGTEFSYCIGRIKDLNDPYSHLIIGDGARIEGDPTPLVIHEGSYYVMLDGISIDKKRIVDEKFFPSPKDGGGVTFDTGTPITYLPNKVYKLLSAEIKRYMKGKLNQVEKSVAGDRLCFYGDFLKDLEAYPDVIFHFSGGVDFDLGPDALFDQIYTHLFCVTIRSTSAHQSLVENKSENITIIGVAAMQDHNFGYDLYEEQVYLEYVDCKSISEND